MNGVFMQNKDLWAGKVVIAWCPSFEIEGQMWHFLNL